MTARPWLLLPIETKAREFDAKLLLAAAVAESGFDVVLGEQNAMVRNIRALPRGVYLDKGVARTKTAPFRTLRDIGNRIVACCEEGLVYRAAASYRHERIAPDSLALIDRFFAWGDVQAGDVAVASAPDAAKIRVTGNPRFDMLRGDLRAFHQPDVDALRRRFGRYILVTTNFGRYNHFLGFDFWAKALKKRGTVANAEEAASFERWRSYLERLYRAFAAAVPSLARAFPDHHIVVRPHPSESHDQWRRELAGIRNVSVMFEGSAVPWLAGADAVVHHSCTTGVEAYLLGRPVVAFRPAVDAAQDSHLPHAVSRSAFTEDELVEHLHAALNGTLTPPPGAAAELARYVAGREGPLAADRIAAILAELAIAPQDYRLSAMDHLRLAGDRLRARIAPLVRRIRIGPRADAYLRQKFPGLTLAEVRAALAQLQQATGRFAGVRADALPAPLCYRISARAP